MYRSPLLRSPYIAVSCKNHRRLICFCLSIGPRMQLSNILVCFNVLRLLRSLSILTRTRI